MPPITPSVTLAAVLCLVPLLAFGFLPSETRARTRELSLSLQLFGPALLGLPYLLVNFDIGTLHVLWAIFYFVLPVAVSTLLFLAAQIDPQQNGAWPDLLVLLFLGLAVDLRWLESAWPPQLAIFSKIILLDAGLWGFFTLRNLHHTGIDLRLRASDVRTGGLNFLLYAPVAIALGFALGFLHLHTAPPDTTLAAASAVFTFLFVAVPEEIFFRGWIQNLLERRLHPNAALALTSVLFGLSHFNKRAAHFNWRYVLLATLAGVFYGRAWRGRGPRHHRVAASALTHTLVDTTWSLFLR